MHDNHVDPSLCQRSTTGRGLSWVYGASRVKREPRADNQFPRFAGHCGRPYSDLTPQGLQGSLLRLQENLQDFKKLVQVTWQTKFIPAALLICRTKLVVPSDRGTQQDAEVPDSDSQMKSLASPKAWFTYIHVSNWVTTPSTVEGIFWPQQTRSWQQHLQALSLATLQSYLEAGG